MKTDTSQQNIPSGWKLKKLGDVLDYERPDKYIVKSTSYSNKAKTPVLTANKSFVLGYIDEDFGVYEKLPAIIFDDFTTDSKLVNFPFKIKSSAIKILKEKNKDIDLRFVFEKMKSVNFPTGSHKRFYISQYQNLEIALPPIKEQQKIAEILGTVDEDIAKIQEVIETTEELKKGLMQELFTRGIGHTKFKKTKIGEIPEEWRVISISEICNVFTGGTPLTSKEEYWNGNIRWMSSGEVNNKRIIEVEKRITEEGLKKSNARLLPVGTVMVALAGQGKTRGMVAILEIETTCNQSLAGIVPKNIKDVYSEYIFYNLYSRYKELRNINGNEGRAGLNLKIIKEIKMPLPLMNEQKEIAEILSAVDEKILVNKKLKEKLTLLKKGLMQDLLSGRVRTK